MISWIVTTIVICIFIDWERVFAKFLRRFRAARTVAGRREWHRVTWPEANATNGSVFIISPSNNQRLMPWRYSYDMEEGRGEGGKNDGHRRHRGRFFDAEKQTVSIGPETKPERPVDTDTQIQRHDTVLKKRGQCLNDSRQNTDKKRKLYDGMRL